MPTIICPRCKAANRPAGLAALVCERCGRTIDPRLLEQSPKALIRKQRRLRGRSASSPGPLGQDEVDELMEWVLDLPPLEMVDDNEVDQSHRGFWPSRVLTGAWRWVTSLVHRRSHELEYGDSILSMHDDGIVINRYYWPFGRKRIRYEEIRTFTLRPLKAWHGQYRVHGVDHRGRWYSRDRHRGEKERAIDLTVGRLIHPVLTPDDVDAVLMILEREVRTAPD